MLSKKIVKKYVEDLCNLLEIKTPKIEYDNSLLFTETQLAMFNIKTNTMTLRTNYPNNYDLLFTIAHELRHSWQSNQLTWLPLIEKSKSNVGLSVKEYNEQLIEIDSHAFATYIMINWFGINPLFNSFDDELKSKIYRLAEIFEKIGINKNGN